MIEEHGRPDRTDHVVHVGEVAALGSITQDGGRGAVEQAAAERLDGQVWALVGSPDREEPQRDELESVESGVECAPLFDVELGERVRAARRGWIFFGLLPHPPA
jgi:hypothetical protein